jgi:hypothetical protein
MIVEVFNGELCSNFTSATFSSVLTPAELSSMHPYGYDMMVAMIDFVLKLEFRVKVMATEIHERRDGIRR